MSGDHPNAAKIRELFAAFRAGDVAAVTSIIDDDVVWRFPGRTGKLAGEHRGRDGVFAFLGDVMALTGGTFHLELEDVVANDAVAVAFFTGHGKRDGKTLHNPTCLKIRMRDRKVVEVWEFVWDLYDVDDFWA